MSDRLLEAEDIEDGDAHEDAVVGKRSKCMAFLSFVKRHTLRPFAYYRILMGIAVFYIFGF